MKRKWLTVGIILLFIAIAYAPATAQNTTKSLSVSRGDWLYVGGSGLGNYTSIQDAIDNASDEDTVFVYSGTYYENIVIDKSIRLLGENRNSTIIHGNSIGCSVNISASNVELSEFMIENSGNSTEDAGIRINSISYQNIISDNIIRNNKGNGIIMLYSTYNLISNNIIKSSEITGLDMYQCDNNSIIGNYIQSMEAQGILLFDSNNNLFRENIIEYCYIGFNLYHIFYNNISWNVFANNSFGILLHESQSNNIFSNNFMYNSIHAFFVNAKNKWIGNYWNIQKLLPKPILGIKKIPLLQGRTIPILWLQYDWHPAQEPYDI